MKKRIKYFFEKFYEKKSSKNTAREIQETVEMSRNDFAYLSVQFLLFGIVPILKDVLAYIFDFGKSEKTILSILALSVFIFQFVCFFREKAKLKKLGLVYNFNLYDLWGFAWFLFGGLSAVITTTLEILCTNKVLTGVVYYVGATVFETINIALAFILLLFSGISLKSYILNIVSVWLLILSPIIVCSKIEGDYLAIRTEESRILAYNEILSSLRPINILIYIIYISIGVFYIGKRRIVNDGIN